MRALIVVDVQNDFCPGGALAVAGGDEIVAPINNRMADFDAVILTQDWHPAGHSSFASSHKAAEFSTIEMPMAPKYFGQITAYKAVLARLFTKIWTQIALT